MTDESRRQFEEWLVESGLSGFVDMRICKNSDGDYMAWDMQLAFRAWQASRAAIVLDVNWPVSNDDTWKDGEVGVYAQGYEDGRDKTVISVVSAAIASGIKLKGIKETGSP